MFNKKNKLQDINEYINIADVKNDMLFTKNGYAFKYLQVKPISTALMTQLEKRLLVDKMTMELSAVCIPFKILFISRPTDVTQLILYYTDILQNTVSQKKKEAIKKTIHNLSRMSTDGGVLERQTYICVWNKRENISQLVEKTNDLKIALTTSGVACNDCLDSDIINMLLLFFNPTFDKQPSVDITPHLTFLEDLQ
ncbi:MAG: hypothetical protein RSA79_00080 [Oscillospiraceae bacterium]